MGIRENLAAAEALLGHEFDDRRLLMQALTHPSAAEGHGVSQSYERMEFLGDSILGAVVANELYQRYPSMDEGELTRLKISLVSGGTLSEVARDLGLEDLIIFGESEQGTGGRGLRSALENVYEALVAALFLDGGPEPAGSFVAATLYPRIDRTRAEAPISYKSQLQEYTQARFRTTPVYVIVDCQGPAHSPTFTCEVTLGDEVVGRGQGHSKKGSETEAARVALGALLARDGGDRS